MGLVINCIVEEDIDIAGESLGQNISVLLAEDFLGLMCALLIDEDLYLTLSLDTERLLPAMHSLPLFNSFCEVYGEIYAASPLGIHRLTGETDNGAVIHTGIVWGRTDFGTANEKRIRAVIFSGEVSSAVIKAETESGSGVYALTKNRANVGRNLLGRNWSIRLADFERLESIEFIPTILGR